MEDKQLMEFVQWLSSKINKTPEETANQIAEMWKTDEGKAQLNELLKEFNSETTGMFKKGGKLNSLVDKFQNGGLTRRQAIDAYMQNNDGVTRSQARQAYRNARNASYNLDRDMLKTDGYANRRDWARRLIAGNTNAVDNSEMAPVYNKPIDVPVLTKTGFKKAQDVKVERPQTMELEKIQVDRPQTMELYTANNRAGFNKAFAAARRAGLKTFKWNGGEYGTRYTTENNEQWKNNLEGIRNKLMVKQDGGTINTPNGPIFETDEGYVDSNGRSVNYQPSLLSRWRTDRKLRKKIEDDAIEQARLGKGIIHDTFGDKSYDTIIRGITDSPVIQTDTIVIRNNDDGSFKREQAGSLKTTISRMLFGDSPFDKINREFEGTEKKNK